MDVKAPEELLKPLVVPYKVLMGPGPTNPDPRVLHALSQPVLGHMHPEIFKIMDEIKQGLQYLFQTRNKLTLALSASGHAGMEAVLCNLLEPGDKILILVNGLWGERAVDMATRYGANVEVLKKSEENDNFSLIEIENTVKKIRPKILFVVQGESSTGIYQPLEGIGEITRRFKALLVVDTVASLGAVPVQMDQWKIDAIYSGSQKIIGVPPGLAPISFGPRALQTILSRRTPVTVYYWDMKLLGQQWNCFEKDQPRLYHHTTSAPLLYALREGLAMIVEEGLENVIERHQCCAERLYKGLRKLGFEFFVQDENKRLPSVTTVNVPKDLDWRDIVVYAMKNYQMEISGGLGPTAGKVLRIGLMGHNASITKVDFVLSVLKEALDYARKNPNGSKL